MFRGSEWQVDFPNARFMTEQEGFGVSFGFQKLHSFGLSRSRLCVLCEFGEE